MAEALGLASSLVALTTFAFQVSRSVYQDLESFKSTKRTVRELRHELDALNQVIEALQKVAVDHEKGLSTLKLPLLRCGRTCKEFEDGLKNPGDANANTRCIASGKRGSWGSVNTLGKRELRRRKDLLVNAMKKED